MTVSASTPPEAPDRQPLDPRSSATATADLLVVVVNHDSGNRLRECLRSLGDCLPSVSWRAVVIDNESHDGSEQAALDAGERVSLRRAGGNLGFGRAVNLATAGSDESLLLVLNPDARLLPGFWDQIREELDAHPRCAVVGPGVLNDDGTPQGNARGDPDLTTGLFGRTTLFSQRWPRSALRRRNVLAPEDVPAGEAGREVDWVAGSCLVVRREAFREVGGFDERYFLYWEDADLCRRLRARGWTIRYRPGAGVVHSGGGSGGSAGPLAVRAFHRSAYVYYRTHVARRPGSPRRVVARAALGLRCRVKLAYLRLAARKTSR